MMRIQMLTGQFVAAYLGNPVAVTTWGSFTVNNAVTEVQMDAVGGAPWYHILGQPSGVLSLFPASDNLIILSITMSLPHYFKLSRPGAYLRTGIGSAIALGGGWSDVGGGTGDISIPEVGAEVALGAYQPAFGGDYAIGVLPMDFWVSMIGVPAALNGVTFYPTFTVKIGNNLDMV